ncbi:unnamed protein product [Cercospora beticola]|nr:unnamed protein product [Cercospora beticola]
MKRSVQMLIFWALQAVLASGQYIKNATEDASLTTATNMAAVTSSLLSPGASQKTPPVITAPPCCWFAGYSGGFGVMANYYYNTSVVQTVATVYSTILDYGDRQEVANVSTSHMAKEDIYTLFGGFRHADTNDYLSLSRAWTELGRLGVPATLVQGYLYAGTHVYQAGVTDVFDAPYPTPWMAWNNVQVWYDTSSACSTTTTDFSSGSPIATHTVPLQSGAFYVSSLDYLGISHDVPGAYTTKTMTWSKGVYTTQHFYIQTLPLNATQLGRDYFPLPSEAIERYLSFQTSAYPWITDCTTADTVGEPTVHIAVTHLTGTSRVTVMMAKPTTGSTTQAQPRPTKDASEPPVTSTPSPPAEHDDKLAPVRTPAISHADSPSSSVLDVAPTQSQTTKVVPDVATIQDQTTSVERLSTHSAETRSEGAIPSTAPASVSSEPDAAGSSQDDQVSAESSSDDIPTGPSVVIRGSVSTSPAVQENALANTATAQSFDTALLGKTSDPTVAVSESVSAPSTVETGTKKRITTSHTSDLAVGGESIPSKGIVDIESDGAAGSVGENGAVSASLNVIPDSTTTPDQNTNTQVSSAVDSADIGSVIPTSGSSAAIGGMGDAIMSGIGKTGTRNSSAGYTGPAYTGGSPGMTANIVVAACLGLAWLAWGCM